MLWVEDLQEESMSDNNDLNTFAKNQLKYRAEFYNSDHFLAHAIDSIEKIASLISASLLDGGKLMFCGMVEVLQNLSIWLLSTVLLWTITSPEKDIEQ